MRRITSIAAALAMALGIASACTAPIDSALENEPCVDDKECSPKQACVRTEAEDLAGLPGQCLPEGSDCDGQLGCPCDPERSNCFSLLADYPEMICDPDQLMCVVEPDEEETEG